MDHRNPSYFSLSALPLFSLTVVRTQYELIQEFHLRIKLKLHILCSELDRKQLLLRWTEELKIHAGAADISGERLSLLSPSAEVRLGDEPWLGQGWPVLAPPNPGPDPPPWDRFPPSPRRQMWSTKIATNRECFIPCSPLLDSNQMQPWRTKRAAQEGVIWH